jgi:hypothetical protein
MNDCDLEKELHLLDKESHSVKRGEEKSTGPGRRGSQRSSNETNKEKGSKYLTQNLSPRATKCSSENSKKLKHRARLVREQRKKEHIKLQRVQEETKLLEEKRRAEEIRLKALQEEAKLFEAKRQQEQDRRNNEAVRAAKQLKAEEARREKELELAREQRKKEEARAARLKEESRIAKEKSLFRNAGEECDHQTSQQSKDIPSSAGTTTSLDCDLISPPSKYGDDVRNNLRRSQLDRANKFRKPQGAEEIQLPPAFQLIHEQTKRIKKTS